MNYRIRIAGIAVFLLLFAFAFSIGCTGTDEEEAGPGNVTSGEETPLTNLNFDLANDGEVLSLSTGDTILISLPENPTTGYSWEHELSGGLSLIEDSFIPDDPTGKQVGAGGIRSWKLKAEEPGNATFSAVYRRPWENVTGEEDTFTIGFVIG
jgi:inhibitor of cysteine peptidase